MINVDDKSTHARIIKVLVKILIDYQLLIIDIIVLKTTEIEYESQLV